MTKDNVGLEELLEKSVEERNWKEFYRNPDWKNFFRGLGIVFLTIIGYLYLGLKKLLHRDHKKQKKLDKW